MKPTRPLLKAALSAVTLAGVMAADPAQAALADTSVYAYTYPTGAGVAIGCSGNDGQVINGAWAADNAIELHVNRYSGAFVCGDIGDMHIEPVSLNGFILWLILP
ncbi:MAG: hypothetical protein HS101_19960 [Planctomycetia bacterium]|nr:hypothetical protein [Planctomycetia bacterium]